MCAARHIGEHAHDSQQVGPSVNPDLEAMRFYCPPFLTCCLGAEQGLLHRQWTYPQAGRAFGQLHEHMSQP